jgi:hypothetical protein
MGLYTGAAYLIKSKFVSRFVHLVELVLRYTSIDDFPGIEGLQFSDLLFNLTQHQNIRKITLVLSLMYAGFTEAGPSIDEIVDVELARHAPMIDEHLSNRNAFPRLDNFTVFLEYSEWSRENFSLKGTIRSRFPKLAESSRLHVLR